MDERVLPITYKTPYRVAGVVLIVFGLPALIPFFGASGGVRALAGIFFLALSSVGLVLALPSRSVRWDSQQKAVVEEKRWPLRKWSRRYTSGQDFVEIEVLSTGGPNPAGPQGYTSGAMVRARHRADSKHFIPGKRSWVLWSYPTLKDNKEQALANAALAARIMELPIDNRLA